MNRLGVGHQCDGQADGRTDGQTDAQREWLLAIAHTNIVKIF